MLEIKVCDVRMVNGNTKLVAYADVEFGGVMLIKGFCIMKSRSGVFAVGPRKADGSARWFDVIIFNPEFWDRLEPLILDAYALEVEK